MEGGIIPFLTYMLPLIDEMLLREVKLEQEAIVTGTVDDCR
jgi:hypothetical protein